LWALLIVVYIIVEIVVKAGDIWVVRDFLMLLPLSLLKLFHRMGCSLILSAHFTSALQCWKAPK